MSKKTPSRIKKTTIASGKEIAVSLLKVLRDFTISDGSICEGRVCVSPKTGAPPVACSFATYPNGDYIVWFNDTMNFHLWALVNEKFKHIATVPPEQIEDLQTIARSLDAEIRQALQD